MIFGSLILLALFTKEALQISYWAHDDLAYLDSYEYKFRFEGRWLIYSLFDWLKQIPAVLAWLTVVLAYFIFFYFVFWRLLKSKTQALLLALIGITSITLYKELLWPQTLFTNAILLLLAIPLSQRLPRPIFFLLFSILFFGSLAHSAYLLPLLFLSEFENKTSSESLALLFKILATWVTSLLLGFATAQLICFSRFGEWIQLQDWRRPNYAHDLGSLKDNLFSNLGVLFEHIELAIPNYQFLFGLWLILLLIAVMKRKDLTQVLMLSIIGIAVGLMHYLITCQAGIALSLKSVHALFIGLVLIFAALALILPRVLIVSVLCLQLALPSAVNSYNDLREYRLLSNKLYSAVTKNMPENITKLKIINIDLRGHLAYWLELLSHCSYSNQVINNWDYYFHMQAVLRKHGFKLVRGCYENITIGKLQCQEYNGVIYDKSVCNPGEACFVYKVFNGRLFLKSF